MSEDALVLIVTLGIGLAAVAVMLAWRSIGQGRSPASLSLQYSGDREGHDDKLPTGRRSER